MKRRREAVLAIMLYAASVFVLSSFKVHDYNTDAKAGRAVVDSLIEAAVHVRQAAPSVTETAKEATAVEQSEETPFTVDFDILKSRNGDIVGWLYCEDTLINYPIVQGADNDYYLHRLVDGTYSAYGTLFLDYRNAPQFTDCLSIIYGHHMNDGSMFKSLENWKKQEFYDSHKYMLLFTPERQYKIELLAGFITEGNGDIFEIPADEAQRDRILKEAAEASTFRSDYSASEHGGLIALSTCSYEYEDARYILLGEICE